LAKKQAAAEMISESAEVVVKAKKKNKKEERSFKDVLALKLSPKEDSALIKVRGKKKEEAVSEENEEVVVAEFSSAKDIANKSFFVPQGGTTEDKEEKNSSKNEVKAAMEKFAAVKFKAKTLDNGLRFLSAPLPGTKTVTILMMFGTGSKYESKAQNGLSHFLEHMFFKGTAKRKTALKISRDLDSLGGEHNAFTSKETTAYYIKVDKSKTSLAMEILSDMLLYSRFSQADIDRERGVIIEEINMYHDNPMMYIEDVFETCLYGSSPAGREIAGPKENIRSFKRQNFLDYFKTQYGANSAVLCLAGAVDEKIEKLAEKFFKPMKRAPFKDKLRTVDAQSEPMARTHYKEGNQANLAVGVRAFDNFHPDKIALKVLGVILGGSMSSRLFTEVREKRGLAYYVHTNCEFYTDTGYLVTYAGVPIGKKDQAIKVILDEYKKLRTQLVSREELVRAKDLIKGRTTINFEESDNVANWYAHQAVLKDKVMSPEVYFSLLDAVKAEDLRRIAKEIFKNEKLNLAIIGPFKDEAVFKSILKIK
jgi:predicted Zn-dependent peptidase